MTAAPKPVLPGITGPIWRDADGDPWEEIGVDLFRAVTDEGDGRGPGTPNTRQQVEGWWGTLTRETPRTWDLPHEPGPEVRAVRTRHGALYCRVDASWVEHGSGDVHPWTSLMRYAALPLTDATAELPAEADAT